MIELTEKIRAAGAVEDTLTLPYESRQKSRQRVRLDSGREAAVILPPGTAVDDGDYLRSQDGATVRVHAASEPVSTARCSEPLRLARACYHLGNRHVALQVGEGWVRYRPDHVLDDMVRGLGLTVAQESAPFQPERGAYGGYGHAHSHSHSHPHDASVDAGASTRAHDHTTTHGHHT